ncbi:hypothetical protein AAMO2058_000049400 [Amorphochlora amoebiformis]
MTSHVSKWLPASTVVILGFIASVGARRADVSHGEKASLEITCDLCEGMVRELHAEVLRHELLEKEGEEGILDSVEAVCLAIVQKFDIYVDKDTPQRLFYMKEEHGEDMNIDAIARSRRLKDICLTYADKEAITLSEAMYRYITTNTPEGSSVEQFCYKRTRGPCHPFRVGDLSKVIMGSPRPLKYRVVSDSQSEPSTSTKRSKKRRKKKKKKKSAKKAARKRSIEEKPGVDTFIKMMRSNPEMKNMLMQEYDDPTISLPEEVRADIKEGISSLKCEICEISVNELIDVVTGLRKRGRGLMDEELITRVSEKLCFTFLSPRTEIAAKMEEIAPPPPSPQLWMDQFHVQKKNGKWNLSKLSTPVAKRGPEIDLETVKAGHVLRQSCVDTVGTNAYACYDFWVFELVCVFVCVCLRVCVLM